MDKSGIPAVVERKDIAPMQGGPAKFVREIDEYLAGIFDEMTQIDENYGKVSAFFTEHANQVVGDRDYEKLSKEEQKLATVYMAAALAVKGACAVVKGIKETIALEKVRRLHRKVAETKYESLSRMIERAQRNHDDAAAVLARHNLTPFQSAEVRKNFQVIANILEDELCQYRDIRFRLNMLLWLKEEYEAWLDDRLYSDTPMPTMGQASVAAIYVLNGLQIPYSREKREKDLRELGHKLERSLVFDRAHDDKKPISSFELLAIIDSQMSAVLEHGYLEKDPLATAIENDGDGDTKIDVDKLSCKHLFSMMYLKADEGSLVKQIMSENRVTLSSLNSFEAFLDMKKDYFDGTKRTEISGFLLIAAVVISIWNFGWAWYWLLALSVIVAIFVFKMFPVRSIKRMTDNLANKFQKMSCNYEHETAKTAGLIEPKSKVREMAKSRNSFWAGLIIGGLIGLVGGPIGIVIGAIIGAILGSGSSDDIDTHGEGWQAIKICSPTKQWITIIIAALLVIFEIYVIFIK